MVGKKKQIWGNLDKSCGHVLGQLRVFCHELMPITERFLFLYSKFNFGVSNLLWADLCPAPRYFYVEVLTPTTSNRDCIWRQGFQRGN